MALTYQSEKNITLSRRDGEHLVRLHPSTTGEQVALTQRNGIEGESVQAELEAIRAKMGNLLAEADAMQYKGVVNTDGELPTTYEPGWLWKVGAAGTYKNRVCEAGDLIIANTSRAGSDNTDADFDIIQGNVERPVSGPASSTANHIAVFDGADGMRIKDSGVTASELGTAVEASRKEWVHSETTLPETMPENLADGGLLLVDSVNA